MSPSRRPSRTVLSDWTTCPWLASLGLHAPIEQGLEIRGGLPRSPPLVLPACFIWAPRWTSPSIGVQVTRRRVSRARRLVRTRNTLPCLLPWDAHLRAPSSMKPELFSSFSPSPVAPYPSKASPRQQPCRVTATSALTSDRCLSLTAVLPRPKSWVHPTDHKALLHCRARCRPRCCHRERPDPSLGLRTDKTFRRFRGCETAYWCSPNAVFVGSEVHAEAGAIRRDMHSGSLAEPPGRLELDRRGTLAAEPKLWTLASTTGIRRRIFERWQRLHREHVAEATPELPMPSRRLRRAPEIIGLHREPAELSLGGSDRSSVERLDLRAPHGRSLERYHPAARRSEPGAEAPRGVTRPCRRGESPEGERPGVAAEAAPGR